MLNRKELAPHRSTVAGGHHHQSGPPPTQMRPHSTPATLLWLEENYEMAQGVSVPRNTLYLHYVDFCSKHGMTPVNAASFGKVSIYRFYLFLPPALKPYEYSKVLIKFLQQQKDYKAAISSIDDSTIGYERSITLPLLRHRHPREFAVLRARLLQERPTSVSWTLHILV